MTQGASEIDPKSVGRVSQIIAAALMMGVLMFAGVAFFMARGEQPKVPMLSFLAIGFAGLMVAARLVLPPIIVGAQKGQLKRTDESVLSSQLAALYQTKVIVGMALLEGAAFFNLVAYLIEKQIWLYGVVAFLLGIMAISFPSQGQFESWADELKRDLN